MFVNPRSAFVGCPSVVCSSSGSAKNPRYARLLPSTRKSSESRTGPSSRTSSSPVSVFGLTTQSYRPRPVAGVPLLSGSRIVTVPVGADDLILRPPPPPTRVADVGAAVRDALAFPLSGPPLAAVARRGMHVTVVVEPPALPLPGAQDDPRPLALATVLDQLENHRVADEDVTLLVAGGLARRVGRKELERLLPPHQARAFRGKVTVHDAAAADLVAISTNVRINPAIVDADLVLVVSS